MACRTALYHCSKPGTWSTLGDFNSGGTRFGCPNAETPQATRLHFGQPLETKWYEQAQFLPFVRDASWCCNKLIPMEERQIADLLLWVSCASLAKKRSRLRRLCDGERSARLWYLLHIYGRYQATGRKNITLICSVEVAKCWFNLWAVGTIQKI